MIFVSKKIINNFLWEVPLHQKNQGLFCYALFWIFSEDES